MTRIIEENLGKLHESEGKLIEEVQHKQEIHRLVRERLALEITKAKAVTEEIRQVLGKVEERTKREIETLLGQMREEMTGKCKEKVEVLEAAERHFKGSGQISDNPVVRVMKDLKTEEEIATTEVIKWRLEAREVDLSEQLRQCVSFSLEIVARPQAAKLPEPRNSPPSDRRTLPRPSISSTGTGKKPITRQLDPKPITASKPKSSNSLNSSLLESSAHSSAVDATKLASKLRSSKSPFEKLTSTKAGSPTSRNAKIVAERRNTVFEIGHFLATPEVKPRTLKSDDEGSSEEEPVLRKHQTEVPEGQLFGRAARLTDLHSARAKNRQSLLQETARKVEDIEEKLKEMKGIGLSLQQIESESDTIRVTPEPMEKPSLDAPVINVTPPYDDKPSSHEGSLASKDKLSLAIAKAAEVSKTLIRVDMPRKLHAQSPKTSRPSRALPGFTVVPISGTRELKMFDLHNVSVREVAGMEEVFGVDAALCVTESGEVVITGGYCNGEVRKSVQIYKPATGEMEGGYSILVARYRHSVMQCAGLIYVIGGLGTARTALRDCEKFDLQGKSCKRIGHLSQPRESHGSCEFEGCIYVAGGSKSTDIVDKLTINTEIFTSIRLQTAIDGASALFTYQGQLLLLHHDSLTIISLSHFSVSRLVSLPAKDWWTAGPVLLHNSTLFLLKHDSLLRLNLATYQLDS